jgi:hypothetical protein
VASLRMNWRKEFLLEVVRLRHDRDIAQKPGSPAISGGGEYSILPPNNGSTTSWAGPCDRCPT